jgi:hypothetical protein
MKKFVTKKIVKNKKVLVIDSKIVKNSKRKNAKFMTMWHLSFWNQNSHVLGLISMNHQISKENIFTWILLMTLFGDNMLKSGDQSFGVTNMPIPIRSFFKWALSLLTKYGIILDRKMMLVLRQF